MIQLRRYLVNISSRYHASSNTRVMLVHGKSSGEHPTAGIIVVGDEILKAQVKDTNSFYASSLLYKHGIRVQKIAIIQDNVEDIAKAIKYFSANFNYVFTTGGIGPTHDDVTYEAVALGFNDTLHYHPRLVDIIKNQFGCNSFPSPAYKMAYIPKKSTFKFGTNEVTGETFPYPCVVVENVYIFPGSPKFFESSFQSLCKELFAGYKRFATTEVFINAGEDSFAHILNDVVQNYPNVSFGSYPECNRYYKARVTIESEDERDTEAARKMFCSQISSAVLVRYDRTPHIDSLSKYEKLLDTLKRPSIYEKPFEIFLKHYRKPEDVWVYFDGSAESVISVHLARVAVEKLGHPSETKLHGIYLEQSDDSRTDMNRFLQEISQRYNVELCSLGSNKRITIRPELRILLLGRRSNDNKKEVYERVAQLSADSFPSVQIHFPLMDWTDEDVTTFVSSLSLPYYTTDQPRSYR
nr:FAD synthase-like isoform X1 [Nomia melanderi]XP_031835722.1 FAD synthase-like isoform X2 [Nomia melanderi]